MENKDRVLTFDDFLAFGRNSYDKSGAAIADGCGEWNFDAYVMYLGHPMTVSDAEALLQPVTYEQFQEEAKRNYAKGGDVIAECWGRSDFDNYISETGSPVTLKDTYDIMSNWYSRCQEYEAACSNGFFDEPWTNEEEIEQSQKHLLKL